MRLIVDTNCIIAALLRDGGSRKIIFTKGIELMTPAYSIEEVAAHREELRERLGMEEEQFRGLLSFLLQRIHIVQKHIYEHALEKAASLIEAKDAPFLALASAVENDGVWSEDRHFEQQTNVKVWKTRELLQLLERGTQG